MKYRILLVLYLVASLAPAIAEDKLPQPLTLRDAINLALHNNRDIKAAAFTAEAAAYGPEIAGAGYLPQLTLEESFAASNAPTRTFMMKLDQSRFTDNDFRINNLNHPGTWHDFRTSLSISQPLFAPSVSPLREMAEKDAVKGRRALDAARSEIAFQTFRVYLDIQRNREQLKAAGQALMDARENLRLAAVRSEAGTGLRSDELRARTHLSQAEQTLIVAQNNLRLAGMQLAIITGQHEDAIEEKVEDTLFSPAVAALPEEMIKIALQERPDLRISRAEVEKAGANADLAQSAYLPAIGASASYQLNAKGLPFGRDNDAWLAGVHLNWQLFDGFRRSGERKKAAAERSAALQMLESRSREAGYQVRESFMRREESGKRLEVARHAVQDAEETVRLVSRRFENSLSTMVELLDAQTALNQARAALVNSQADFALAGGRIYFTAGIFLKEMLP